MVLAWTDRSRLLDRAAVHGSAARRRSGAPAACTIGSLVGLRRVAMHGDHTSVTGERRRCGPAVLRGTRRDRRCRLVDDAGAPDPLEREEARNEKMPFRVAEDFGARGRLWSVGARHTEYVLA
jgi:hypothetical protein